MSTAATAWVLETAGEPLVQRDHVIPAPAEHEAVVEVLACGLCHTDLGFADGSVPPKMGLPLVLGHEAVGTVVAAGAQFTQLVGRKVIVPAVLPCGDCDFCRCGRGNACTRQAMPGNDIHGGFATHMLVPGAPLVDVEDAPDHIDIRLLAVVADAVSTAWQGIRRSGLAAGDACFIVGAGGVGGYAAQIASALGAKVVTMDLSDERLAAAREAGADETINVSGLSPRDIKKQLRGMAKGWGISTLNWRIIEASGSPPGQELAYSLLGRGAVMVQLGYTPAKVNLRLSNIMAFDATIHGSWGCPPDQYAAVLQLIYDGKVDIASTSAHAPMSKINDLLDDMANHRLTSRMVLDPRA